MVNITNKVMTSITGTDIIETNSISVNTIDKVVLINTVAEKGIIDKGELSSSLRLIREALRESGYEKVLLYPPYLIEHGDAVFGGIKRMIDNLETKLKNEWNIVFGFSVYTGAYWVFQELAKLIRERFPFSTIVAGGPHFARETIVGSDGVRCLDSVEVALSEIHKERQITDFVVVGDAQPFIDFITIYQGKYPKDGGIQGMYQLSKNGVVGQGKGSFPQVSVIPYPYQDIRYLGKKVRYVSVYFDEICHNGCDYCSVSRLRKKIPQDIAVKSISSILNAAEDETNLAILHFLDSNPLEINRINQYKTLIDSLKTQTTLPIYLTFFLDSGLLIEDDYFDKLVKFFNDYNVIGLFIGRDCVDENVAEKMGRRFRGKIRTQKQLDMEGKGIKKLLNEWCYSQHFQRKHLPHYVYIAYIFTPFDTYESTRRIIEESSGLENMSTSTLSVSLNHFILTPRPSTALRKLYSRYLREPENFGDITTRTNVWSHELSPQVYFLNRLPDILNMPMAREGANKQEVTERRKLFYDTLREELEYTYKKHKPASATATK